MDQFVRSYLKQWELEELIPRFEGKLYLMLHFEYQQCFFNERGI